VNIQFITNKNLLCIEPFSAVSFSQNFFKQIIIFNVNLLKSSRFINKKIIKYYFFLLLNKNFFIYKNMMLFLRTQKFRLKNNFFLIIILLSKIQFAVYKNLMLKLGRTSALFFSKKRIRRKKLSLLSPVTLIVKIVQWLHFNVQKLVIKNTLMNALHKEFVNSFIFSFLGYYQLRLTAPKRVIQLQQLAHKVARMQFQKQKKVTFTK